MANYTSKFTGSEIDGILDEAIELPSVEGLTGTNLLSYDNDYIAWQDSTQIVDRALANVEGANTGYILKYANDTNHLYWDAEFSIDTSNAHDGNILKYSSDSGFYWGDSIDTDGSNDGDVLKYGSNTGIYWGDSIDTDGANDGDVLKYGSNTGVYWDSTLDTTNANDGDVLKYSSNTGIYWDAGQSIDMTNANDGNILKYSSNTGMYWDSPDYLVVDDCGPQPGDFLMYTSDCGPQWESIFPIHDANDAGKVLTVADNGAIVWMNPNDAITLYNQTNNN